jgi:large repetitive protein
MDFNQRHSWRPRRAAPRRSFKPEVEILEKRALLSSGLAVSVGTVSSGGATSSPVAGQSGAAVVFSKEQLQVTPGGPGDSYTIVLATQPTADVTITINQAIVDPLPPVPAPVGPPSGGPLQVTPSTLTFTSGDWSTAQSVQVTEPAVPQPGGATGWVGPQVALLHDVSSDDANYNGLSVPPVLVREVNPNQGTVVLSKDNLQVTRGGAGDSYTIALATQPTADVTITITQLGTGPVPVPVAAGPAGGGPGGPPVIGAPPYPLPGGNDPLQISPTTLVFTAANWNTPQTVTVGPPATGSGDQVDFLLQTAASADPNYNGIVIPPVTVEVIDNTPAPTGALVFSKDQLDVTAGGAGDSYTVALASQPAANVTVTIAQVSPEVYVAAAAAASAPAGSTVAYPVPVCWGPLLNVAPATLTFTPADWNTPQTVTVTAPALPPVPVPYAGSGTVTVSLFSTVTSTDPNYNDLCVPPVTVTVHEATAANGAAVLISTDHLNVIPGGSGATYTVVLASKPTDTVTVTIAAVTGPTPPAGAGPDIPVPLGSVPLQITPATLTFTPDNWDTPQTVTVSAPTPGPEFGFDWLASTVTSNDADYNGIYVPPVFVAVVAPTVPPPVGPPVVVPGGSDPSQAAGTARHRAQAHHPGAPVIKKVRHPGPGSHRGHRH